MERNVYQPTVTIALKRTARIQGAGRNTLECESTAEPVVPSHEEPYLVVRLMAGVYQREAIKVLRGPHPLAQIGQGCCLVVHPHAYDSGGTMTPECRSFLVTAVQNAVTTTRLRMCLVWAPYDCTFVEPEGSIHPGSEPPSGGFPLPAPIAFDRRGSGAGVLPFVSIRDRAAVQSGSGNRTIRPLNSRRRAQK